MDELRDIKSIIASKIFSLHLDSSFKYLFISWYTICV